MTVSGSPSARGALPAPGAGAPRAVAERCAAEGAGGALRHPLPHARPVELVVARRLDHRGPTEGLEAHRARRHLLVVLVVGRMRLAPRHVLDAHSGPTLRLAPGGTLLAEDLAEGDVLQEAADPDLSRVHPEVHADGGPRAGAAVRILAVPLPGPEGSEDDATAGARDHLALRPREVEGGLVAHVAWPVLRQLLAGPRQAAGLEHEVPRVPTPENAAALFPHHAGVGDRLGRALLSGRLRARRRAGAVGRLPRRALAGGARLVAVALERR
eukprot:CAMPEP_0176247594 /NCGR_PEP_ID=MMETSP0121_2-20121125/33035_1 /TAXON_ID=160619 /ORGANISM="Kryptoperidinium foliaceum, Strain CCMP 1326" /LENGTH=269 /DNA_ID=CAMNT_0017587253 /DNA_START=87 /DNA_END=892 /DNA_ORIENTATION=+